MKVVFTDEALSDLKLIADHLAQFDEQRARTFVADLLSKARGLDEMPLRFPLVPRYAHLGVRRRVHRNYLIFY